MLEDLRKHIEKLVALYEAEKQRCATLSSELAKSKELVESYRNQVIDLNREIENLKLTQAFTAFDGGTPQAKEKIDRMIRTIDRCISLLEKEA